MEGAVNLLNLVDTVSGSVPDLKYSTLFKLSGVYSLASWTGFVSNSIVAVTTDDGLVNVLFVLFILAVNSLTIPFLTVFPTLYTRHVSPLFWSYPTHTA